MRIFAAALLALSCARPGAGDPAAPARASAAERVLDDFETVAHWSALPSDGVSLSIAGDAGVEGSAMRLDVDYQGGGGYAIARRELALEFPENYEFSFRIRGDIPPQALEFKMVDPSGDNVWWVHRPNFQFPREWTRVSFRKRHVSFAWGPARGGDIPRMAALEVAITAASGGSGSVWIDQLAFRELEPVRPYDLVPVASASSAQPGFDAALVLDDDSTSEWRSRGAAGAQWLALDFQRAREFGGLVIDWDPAHRSADYTVEISADGSRWEPRYEVTGARGPRDYIAIPETEARHIRLVMQPADDGGVRAIRSVNVRPLAFADSRTAVLRAVAADAPRGSWPRYFDSVQTYWTVVGAPSDPHEGLLNEDGLLELQKGGFSVEPFIRHGDRLVSWAGAERVASLERDDLPIPSVRWRAGDLTLTVTAFGHGQRDSSAIWARYRVENRSGSSIDATLLLAVRPLQVNPPWQFLNIAGGAGAIRTLTRDGREIVVGDRRVVAVTPPGGFGATTFHGGDISAWLREGTLPTAQRVEDETGFASGAISWPLSIPAGAAADVWIAAPLHEATPPIPPAAEAATARAAGERALGVTRQVWEAIVDEVRIDLPREAGGLAAMLRSTLAWILINRDGPAIQPGSRAYERSWIRDGSLTSSALLRLGRASDVREFIDWFAPFQFASGKIPCCVDHRGADPVPEHDSHGQFIWLVMEYYRFTGDRALLERMWPRVERTVAHIDSLRRARMTPEYETPEKRPYFGLVPESISHEGYSEKPMHSYWDQLFVLRGLKDAAAMALELGHRQRAVEYARMRDDFRRDLLASYRGAMALHGIDYLPGAVELGDFDATSVTVALDPVGELAHLPRAALDATFQRYWEFVERRRDGTEEWEAYTPYELRSVGAFVRLGQPERAHVLLEWLARDRRPLAWNHWAEVVWREPAMPRFIGDMPHTWVGSDFIRSALDFFAYEEEADSSLIVGAGIPEAWARGQGGVTARGLHTHYGRLTMSARAQGEGGDLVVRVEGNVRVPSGGILVLPPGQRAGAAARVNGAQATERRGAGVVVRRLPSEVRFRY